MLNCINCHNELVRQEKADGHVWGCPECGSRAASLKTLRHLMGVEEMNRFLAAIEGKDPASGRTCPGCGKEMRDIEITREPQKVKLDVCLSCRMVWFDPEEHDQMSAIAAAAVLDVDWQEYQRRETVDRKRAAAYRRKHPIPEPRPPAEPGMTEFDPMEFVPLLMGWLGLPLEEDPQRFQRPPLITWGFATACVLATLAAMLSGRFDQAIHALGFIPEEPFRYGGFTLVSSVLLHGSLWHLLSNMYFLLVFGDNVEDALGPMWFVLLLVASAWMGDAIAAFYDPRTHIPSVGASGAISGVLAYYAFRFPRVKLAVMFRYFLMFKWFRFPAWVLFALWIAMQLVTAMYQVNGQGTVSALAHLGGVAAGIAFWAATRVGPSMERRISA